MKQVSELLLIPPGDSATFTHPALWHIQLVTFTHAALWHIQLVTFTHAALWHIQLVTFTHAALWYLQVVTFSHPALWHIQLVNFTHPALRHRWWAATQHSSQKGTGFCRHENPELTPGFSSSLWPDLR